MTLTAEQKDFLLAQLGVINNDFVYRTNDYGASGQDIKQQEYYAVTYKKVGNNGNYEKTVSIDKLEGAVDGFITYNDELYAVTVTVSGKNIIFTDTGTKTNYCYYYFYKIIFSFHIHIHTLKRV